MNPLAPTGCITLVFTDVEGSTSLWEADTDSMRSAIALHNELFRARLVSHGGYEVKTEGDAFMVAFAAPAAALAWCLDCQLELLHLPWPDELLRRAEAAVVRQHARLLFRGLRVRMGLHLGTPDCEPDPTTGRMDYFGPMVNRAARVGGSAHGGQILLSGAAHAALSADFGGVKVKSLGTYNLKGLSTPEQLLEVLPESLADRSFPPPKGQALRRPPMPVPASSCLGRERELSELAGALGGGCRLVTVLGPGGIGKTRLVVEMTRRLASNADREPVDVAFCDLTRATGARDVAELVARSVGCPQSPSPRDDAVLDAVGAHLAEAGAILVVLDNFEQVASHAAATVGRWLQVASSQARFLVTSREPLALVEELEYRLEPLAMEDAVTLFIQRAGGTAVGKPQVVEEIVRRLDGIPLALELAAGRAGVLSLEQIRDQLSRRFRLLASRKRDVPVRQATLRGAIDWSWNLLSESERSVLSQLSVFCGFTLEAAEKVIRLPADTWALDVLQSLVDRSMVVAEPGAGEMRFRLLESIRDYARERLGESDEAAAARVRHAAYFANRASTHFTGAFLDDDRIDRDGLEAERDNLAAALDCEELPPEQRCRAAIALCGHAYVRRPPELGALAARAVGLARKSGSPALQAQTLDHMGICRWLEGDHEAALAALQESLAFARQAGEPRLIALTLKDMSNVQVVVGREAEGEALLLEAMAPARATGDPSIEARILGNFGQIRNRQCRYSECLELFTREKELIDDRPDSFEMAFALSNLGGALMGVYRLDEAREAYARALSIYTRHGHFRFESMSRCNLAYVHMMRGEGSLLLDELRANLVAARRFALKWAIGHSLITLGSIRLESGEASEALELLGEAMIATRDSGDRNMLAFAFVYRAVAHALLARPDQAIADLAQARAMLGEGQLAFLLTLEGFVPLAEGLAAQRAGRPAEAAAHLSAARAVAERARGWRDGSLPPPVDHPGGRFVGVALPLLERSVLASDLPGR
ncbi:MAG: AAA family ATPase [Candidatus Wallbacteria bacterium]|nr:AAA family ATPase [Candidatus Wallbacteria bacterium]